MVRELRSRARDINSGELHTVVFMQTSVPRKAGRRGGAGGVAAQLQENTGERFSKNVK